MTVNSGFNGKSIIQLPLRRLSFSWKKVLFCCIIETVKQKIRGESVKNEKNRGSNHSLQKKASAAVGSCLRSVRLPALLVLFLILFSFIFINTNYRNLDVSALRNAVASPDNDLSFFDTMPATPAPNNAGSVCQSKYEIVPGKVYKLGDCDKHVNDMQQDLCCLGICLPMNLRMFFNKPLEQAVKLFQRANHLAQKW